MHVSGSDLSILQWCAPGTPARLASFLEWMSAIRMFLKTTADTCALIQNKLIHPLPPVGVRGYKLSDLEFMMTSSNVKLADDFNLIKLYFRHLTQYENT